MSLSPEQLDIKVLNRLDLPKTVESPQGLNTLYLQKLINLVYNVNDLYGVPHKADIRAAAAIVAAGVSFAAPINAKRIIFNMFVTTVTTATVGTRTWIVRKVDKASNILHHMIVITAVASTTQRYIIVQGTASGLGDVGIELNSPEVLEPEWSILVDDTANVDNADTVAWNIEYLEIPV